MPGKLAAQFYTLREFTKTADGLKDALRRVAEIGYPGVQLSGVGCMEGDAPEVDAATARGWLDEFGLVCCATHRPLPRIIGNTDEEIAFHQTLGCDYAAIGGIWDYGRDADSFRRFLRDVAPAIEKLKSAGIRFGYHNHSHEFIKDAATGKHLYDVLLNEASDDLYLEVDTFWVIHGGLDPAKFLAAASGRIPVIHMKDMEVVDQDGPVMAPVGEGNMDWPAICDAAEAGGTEWYVVEQDTCRRDPFDCLASSYEYLKELV